MVEMTKYAKFSINSYIELTLNSNGEETISSPFFLDFNTQKNKAIKFKEVKLILVKRTTLYSLRDFVARPSLQRGTV